MRTRTLSELVADVRFLADIEALTVRYTTAKVERLVNDGFAAYLALIGGDDGRVLRRIDAGQLTASSDYSDITGLARVRGVALIGNDGEWYELEEATSDQAAEFFTVARNANGDPVTGEPTATAGIPRYWWIEVQQVAAGSTTAATGVLLLHFWPPTDRARAMHAIVEDDPPTLVEAAGKVPESEAYFPIGRGDEYVVAWAALKIATRDGDTDRVAMFSALVSKLEQEIRAKKRSFSGGTASRRDTRGERRGAYRVRRV